MNAASGEIIDASGIAPRIEAMLPAGVRARQLRVRTLLAAYLTWHLRQAWAPLPYTGAAIPLTLRK